MVDEEGRGKQSQRTPSNSLCTTPVDPPRSFHFAAGANDDVRREVVDVLYAAGGTPAAIASRIGDVYGRMRAAARGELVGADLLEPVRDQPELWEIKWKLRKVGEFRMYHAEPGASPELVALRFHRKDVSSDHAATIHDAQEAEMALAAKRYADGVLLRWGHTHSCNRCVGP